MKNFFAISFILFTITACNDSGSPAPEPTPTASPTTTTDGINGSPTTETTGQQSGGGSSELVVSFSSKTLSVGGSVDISASGGTGSYNYSLSSNYTGLMSGSTFNATAPGTVTVTVSDGTQSKSVLITVKGVVELGAYSSGTCAKLSTGEVQCFGADKQNILAPGSVSLSNGKTGKFSPKTATLPITSVVKMVGSKQRYFFSASGNEHFCFLSTSGGVSCVGESAYGALGDRAYSTTSSVVSSFVSPSGLDSGVSELSGAKFGYCAVIVDGTVRCWGQNYAKLVSDTSTTGLGTPTIYSSISNIQTVKMNDVQACALSFSGLVYCWGDYLGQGTLSSGATGQVPTLVSGLSGVTKLSVGEDFACAVTSSGSTYCWGMSAAGKLGTDFRLSSGNTAPASGTPVLVNLGGLSVSKIVSSNRFTCALMANGSVKCWGDITPDPSVSQNTSVLYSPTTMITSGVDDIVAGEFHVCSRFTSGELKCIGSNEYGQMGAGQVIGSTTFTRPLDWE